MSTRWLFFFILLFGITNNASAEEEKKDYLIVRYPSYNPGMFFGLNTVICLLDMYDKGEIAGLKVDFQEDGPYYDPKHGENWWSYYFEPLELGDNRHANVREVTGWEGLHPSLHTEFTISKQRVNDLIQQYMRIKPFIQNELNKFVDKHFKNHFVIGIHYRGTDKISEAPKVAYETVVKTVLDQISKYNLTDFRIFVATDEEAFFKYMKKHFSKRMVYQQAYRSKNGQPVHLVNNTHPFERGKEALLDSLLLSHSNLLIRTSSTLSLWSTYFNPHLKVILLNTRYPGMGPPTSCVDAN